jgi:tetratricopeptide (TPR) repeat protein
MVTPMNLLTADCSISDMVASESLREAGENLGFVLGGTSRRYGGSARTRERGIAAILDLARHAARQGGGSPRVQALFAQFALSRHSDPAAIIAAMNLASPLAALLAAYCLFRQPRGRGAARLREYLAELMDADASLLFDVVAECEQQALPATAVAVMKDIYRRRADAEGSLGELLRDLANLPDRERAVRTLIRALGLELCEPDRSERSTRLGVLLADLERLLLVLGFSHDAATLAAQLTARGFTGLSADAALQEILKVIEDPWLSCSWAELRLTMLGIAGSPFAVPYLKWMVDIVRRLPERCIDDERRGQALDSLGDVLEAQDDPK